MKKTGLLFLLLGITVCIASCQNTAGIAVVQTSIPRIEQMPDMPGPYKIINWKQKALQFDSLVFNFSNTTANGPLIWLDSSRRNFDQVTYGLYTVMGDVRQGPKKNHGEFHTIYP